MIGKEAGGNHAMMCIVHVCLFWLHGSLNAHLVMTAFTMLLEYPVNRVPIQAVFSVQPVTVNIRAAVEIFISIII